MEYLLPTRDHHNMVLNSVFTFSLSIMMQSHMKLISEGKTKFMHQAMT